MRADRAAAYHERVSTPSPRPPAGDGGDPGDQPGVTDVAPAACGALDDDLGWALGVVLRAYRKVAAAVFADLPGGPRGYQVIAASAREDLATQLALAQQLGIDRTVMTYLLDDLQSAGLVERKADPGDRRARRVVVTDAGRDRLADIRRQLRHAEEHVLSPLAGDDVAAFRGLLQRLATHVDELDHVAPCTVVRDLADVGDASGDPCLPAPRPA
jgi:DNA-binding MarR family transcriptional regulator